MPPLRFRPLYKNYLWGGRRLGSLLGKTLPPEGVVAESWEIVDHGPDQSVVLAGDWAGKTLGELVREEPAAILGRHTPTGQQTPAGRFPLLFKFLDARQPLSVQVHPNDRQAALLSPPDLGKTEAWVVLAAEPGSVIYAGLKRGFDRAALAREVARGTTELCLHRFEPQVGDCIFLPAGAVHALGAGLVIAEIQQSSDTTYRLFDWNRVGPDGQPRPLHIDAALDVIDYALGPVAAQTPISIEQGERLVACDKFTLDRYTLDRPKGVGGDERFHILSVLSGEIAIAGDPTGVPLRTGDTALLPAAAPATRLEPRQPSVVLDAYIG